MRLKVGSRFRTPKYTKELEAEVTKYIGAKPGTRRIKAMHRREIGTVVSVTDFHINVQYSKDEVVYSWPHGSYEKYQRRVLRRRT